MKIDSIRFREQIYDLAYGDFNLQEYPVPEGDYVKNEFASGSVCCIAYEEMLAAYSRICQRLQVEEWNDRDVEIIINNLLGIGKHLSMKMFEYGVFFARREA